MIQLNAPKCCGKPMEVKSAYFFNGRDFGTGSHTYFCFQCKKCGKVMEVDESGD